MRSGSASSAANTTAALEQAVIGKMLDQRVLEAVGRFALIALDEGNLTSCLGEPLQRRLQRAFVEGADWSSAITTGAMCAVSRASPKP